MPIRIECQSCKSPLKVADEIQGKKIRCPKCKQVTLATPLAAPAAPKPPPLPAVKARPVRPKEAVAKGPPPLPRSPRRRQEESYDEPVKKSKSSKTLIWAGVGGGGFLVLAAVLAIALWGRGSDNPPKQVAQNNGPPQDPAANPQPLVQQGVAMWPQPVAQQAEIPAGPLPAQIDPATTKKVKRATAYLRVNLSNGQSASGSGFFAIEKGLVFTNAHVLGMLNADSVAPTKFDIVVNSGEPDEFTRTGRILGVDRDNDLAILRVDGDQQNLPAPLAVDTLLGLTELQDVYIFGYPLGENLGKNITISKSTISSIRKDTDGAVNQIQVNGGMHSGNSGGPVVDSRGVVIGVSVAIIQGTQLNFAVPGEKVLGLLRGRADALVLGEAYRNDKGIKLPIELTLLDPMKRLQDVKIEIWTGKFGPARPLSLKQPPAQPGDGPRQTIDLPYRDNKAVAEIDLPNGSQGNALWLQPYLTDKAGVKHWGTATAYKIADYVPLDRKAAVLQHRFENGGLRTVKFANIYKELVSKGGKHATLAFHFETEAVENANASPRGGELRLTVANSKFSVDLDGKALSDFPEIKALSLMRGKTFTFTTNSDGFLLSESTPVLAANNPQRADFESMATGLSNAFESTLLSLPNREVQPKETWNARVPFFLTSPGTKKEAVDMFLQCTLEGVRSAQGVNQAVISVTGKIMTRPIVAPKTVNKLPSKIGPKGPTKAIPKAGPQGGTQVIAPAVNLGKVTGKVIFDLERGFISDVKLRKDSRGFDDSQYVEVRLTRVAGNTTGITPAPAPAPNLAKENTQPAPAKNIPPEKAPSNHVTVISGEMFPFLKKAVQDYRLADADLRGFTGTRNQFRQISPDGGLLIGFEIGFVNNDRKAPIEALRPIFLTATGEKMGTWQGKPPTGPVTVKAKPGYVVAGMNFRAGLGIDGFALQYMKLAKDRLDTADSYTDDHIGSMGGGPSKIGGTGAFVVGIIGHQHDNGNTCALGFVVVATEKKLILPENPGPQLAQADEPKAMVPKAPKKIGYFQPLALDKAATIVSTRGMFNNERDMNERMVFSTWGAKNFEGIPFQLVDPRGDSVPNAILLYSRNGQTASKMPKSVSLPCNASAAAIHLLGGVSGWGFPSRGDKDVVLIVRLHYQGGKTEDHELRNGEHFADYISRVDVPLSKFAFLLEGGKQIRYLAIKPQSRDTIESIEFVKGPHESAPLIMAVTVEALKPGTKVADAKKPNPNSASKKDSAGAQPEQTPASDGKTAPKGSKAFAAKNGMYTIMMPDGVSSIQRTQVLKFGTSKVPVEISNTVLADKTSYLGASMGLPAKNVKEIPADSRFDFIKDALMKTRNGKFTAEKDISQNTIPGKEYMIELPNGQARMQLYTVAGWVIYAIVEGQTRDQVTSARANAFFASLKLSDKARDVFRDVKR